MAKQLRVIHAQGEDDFPGEFSFGVEEGVLLVFSDRRANVVARAYNREVWAYAEYREV